MLLVLILCVPAVVALLALVVGWRPWVGRVSAVSNVAVLVLGGWLAARTLHATQWGLGHVLRSDSLSAVMVLTIAAVSVLATSFTTTTLSDEPRGASHARLYVVLIQAFTFFMLSAVLVANLGLMWVCVEATTVATTFLVSFRRTPGAFEASWKYLLLCSVGIAVAFVGTVLLSFAELRAPGVHSSSLDWPTLIAAAPHLDPHVVRLAFALLTLGYGTKVGLAPMHSWLPDAHSQAPAPVSAMMSGVLLAVAFYAVLRVRAIAVLTLGTTFPREILFGVGVASVVVAAAMMIAQRDLKRLLAYSSVEHMGLVAVAAGVGTEAALVAVLLHVMGHGLTKGALFVTSGELLHDEGTTEIAALRGLLVRRPATAVVLVLGLASLLAMPPFSLFTSEVMMMRAAFAANEAVVALVVLAGLVVVFAAITRHALAMLAGPGEGAPERPVRARGVSLAALVASAALGLLAWPLMPVLVSAAHEVTR